MKIQQSERQRLQSKYRHVAATHHGIRFRTDDMRCVSNRLLGSLTDIREYASED